MMMALGKLLEEIAGINPRGVGENNLARAVRERMSACNLSDEAKYLEKVRGSSREMESLIESVVVGETFFFRDKDPFTFLGQYVRDRSTRQQGTGLLRILSAPCSSGEEPYSIAMELHESGLKPDEYRIDALDISRSLLSRAERAVYTAHSFRGVPELLRNRYFMPAGREYVLKDAIRHSVHFTQGDLLDERVLATKEPYEIVFCRNLLIYLGSEARTRLMNNVERLVATSGYLFVGHAETSRVPAEKFKPLDNRGAFGFRKVELRAATANAGFRKSAPEIHSPDPVQILPKAHSKAEQRPALEPEIRKPGDSFRVARQLADQGRLPEAAEICERLLLEEGTNADTYCLLGAVQHGLGNLRRAEECFSRAIYLDGRCYDAIVHLSMIKQHRGDSAGAEVLRRRAGRILPRTGNP